MIEAGRVRLRCWREADHEAFPAMSTDPDVMRDLGGPSNVPESILSSIEDSSGLGISGRD